MAPNKTTPPLPPMREPPYAEHLYDLYRARLLGGEAPVTTTDPYALEEQARRVMTAPGAGAGADEKADEKAGAEAGTGAGSRAAAFGYIAGGAGAGTTMAANRRALDAWALVPRAMRRPGRSDDGGQRDQRDLRDLRVRLFGGRGRGPPVDLPAPVAMAPVGVQSAYHADRELGAAAACAALGVPFSLSTAASSTIEEVAAAVAAVAAEAGEAGEAPGPWSAPAPWFQLYWPQDDDITASLLRRARAAGCRVLLVTVDTFTIAWRPTDLDAGYLPFLTTGEGNAVGFSDPVFRQKLAADAPDAADATDADAAGEPPTPENSPLAAALRWTSEAFPRRARPWSDLAVLRRLWGDDGALLVKGVLHPEDARLARQHGADGVVVSNHGGRQVDGAVAALDMLPEVVAAVGGTGPGPDPGPDPDFAVLFDSGIRTGADIIKALCLGAQAVLVGRPVVYGLGIAGRAGAHHVLAGLLADLDQTMNLLGCASLADLGPHMLRPAPRASL